jgi:hypothetical protein
MQNRDKSSLAYRLPRLPGARVHPTPTAEGLALMGELKTACILLVNGHAFLLDEVDLREAATAPTDDDPNPAPEGDMSTPDGAPRK